MLSPLASSVVSAVVCAGAGWAGRSVLRRTSVRQQFVRLGVPSTSKPRVPVPTFLPVALADAGVAADPYRVTLLWLGLAVGAGGVGGLLAGPVAGTALLAVVGVLPPAAARLLAGRQIRLADAQLPGLLDQVGRSLRGGASLHIALADGSGVVGTPLRHEVDRLQGELDAGAPLIDVLDRWADRCPRPAVRLVVAALASSAESGGAGARAVDGVAASLRASAAVTAEVRALASQARYSALVIALAPLAFSVLAVSADHRTAGFLLETRLGQACLLGGLALDATGVWWMQRIVGEAR